MRIADGNPERYVSYQEMPMADVWRIYAQQYRYFLEQHKP